jgi:hypothetical protein
VTVVPGQTAPDGLAMIFTLTGAAGLTLMVRLFDAAGDPVAQAKSEVMVQVTTSPFRMVDEAKLAPVATPTPLTIHWNTGVVPPLTGVAVKVTVEPVQTAPEGDAAIVTLAGIAGMILIPMPLLVAESGLAQLALEVRTQFTTSPSVNELLMNVELLVPAKAPLTSHW